MQKAALWQMMAMLLQAFAVFLTGFGLLHSAETQHYALFALSQVVQGTANGVINALCAAPLLMLLNKTVNTADNGIHRFQAEPSLKCYGLVACGIALGAALIQLLLALLLAWPLLSVVAISCCTFLLSVRWYLRAVAQNTQQSLVVFSDLLLAISQLLGLLVLFLYSRITLFDVSVLLVCSALFSLWPFWRVATQQLQGSFVWQTFRNGYRDQGKPALSGMISVEMATNFHSYAIVLLAGAAAYAPIAAAAMFLRPMTIVQNSLQQYFRPLLVRHLTSSALISNDVRVMVTHLLYAAVSAWFLNVFVIVLVAIFSISWLWPESTTQVEFFWAIALSSVWYLLRSLRIHTSSFLQAANCFDELAKVTWISSLLLMPLVLLALIFGTALMTLGVAIASELYIVVRLHQLSKNLRGHLGTR
jgi:hypothetical protein